MYSKLFEICYFSSNNFPTLVFQFRKMRGMTMRPLSINICSWYELGLKQRETYFQCLRVKLFFYAFEVCICIVFAIHTS